MVGSPYTGALDESDPSGCCALIAAAGRVAPRTNDPDGAGEVAATALTIATTATIAVTWKVGWCSRGGRTLGSFGTRGNAVALPKRMVLPVSFVESS